jgi:heme exporter protein A
MQVTGPNGCGKTSLLRIICGLLQPEEGSVSWRGENIRKLGEEYFAELTYLGHRNGIKDELTSIENLRSSCGLSGKRVSVDAAVEVLQEVGLAGRERLPVRVLSQGQRRRLSLARLSALMSPLWVLDEVLTSLDQAAVGLARSLISAHLERGGVAIVATHQDLELPSTKFERIQLSL